LTALTKYANIPNIGQIQIYEGAEISWPNELRNRR
jgi:hypothetical protein